MAMITVNTEITLNLLRPNSGVVVYAKQYDKASRAIDINLVSGSQPWVIPNDVEMVVMYSKPDGRHGMYDLLEDGTTRAVTKLGTSKIRIVLAEQALTAVGTALVEVCFFSEESKLTTLSFAVAVERGVSNEEIASDDYINVLTNMIQGLLGATIYPPQIDPATNNWLTWDVDSLGYVDSGVSALGVDGPQGPRGYYVTDVDLIDGDGSPGTIDEYGVFIENGEQVGSLFVYNGQDGEGAPGLATPQADGTGAAGTSTSFSREDHVHPANVSSSLPEPLGTATAGTSTVYSRQDHVHQLPTASDLNLPTIAQIKDFIYPVGAIYMSYTNVSPASLFGGSWTAISGRFLLAADSTYTAQSTGGAATVKLTANQSGLRAHTHAIHQSKSGATGTAKWVIDSGGSSSSVVVDDNSALAAAEAHNNMPPYLAVYMWRRVS